MFDVNIYAVFNTEQLNLLPDILLKNMQIPILIITDKNSDLFTSPMLPEDFKPECFLITIKYRITAIA
jgi:hypothetical protein